MTKTKMSSNRTKAVGLKYGFRSGLEEQEAQALGDAKVPFAYESFKMPYRVERDAKYTPDFLLLRSGIVIETKGRFVSADRQKHKLIKAQHPDIPTKSGIMVGLGETFEQVQETLQHLADHDVEMITIGQYLQPTQGHLPVMNYWTPDEFKAIETYGYTLGFKHIAAGPLVRSSYHADVQAHEAGV